MGPEMRPRRASRVRRDPNVSMFALARGAEAEGFEPPMGYPALAFKVCEASS
jgi:hypothetical protein